MKKPAMILGLALSCLSLSSQNVTGKSIDAKYKNVLIEIMKEAKVTDVEVTSLNRTIKEQVDAMFTSIEKNGVAKTKEMYGAEGDAVVDKYDEGKKQNKSDADIKKIMETELTAQLPSAIKNNRLMHVGREKDYVVFDISLSKLKPVNKKQDFENVARAYETSGKIHRFLGTGNGESDAFHFEFKK